MKPISIVMVAPDPLLGPALRDFLEKNLGITVLGRATTLKEAITLIGELRPDVVTCGVKVPGPHPAELAQLIRDRLRLNTPVLALAVDRSNSLVLQSFSAGVAGYLLTDESDPEALMVAIRAVHRGFTILGSKAREALETKLGGGDPAVASDWRLTPKQHELLHLLTQGLDTQEVAQRLGISPRTVQLHVTHIMRALGCRSRTEAVAMALRVQDPRRAANGSA